MKFGVLFMPADPPSGATIARRWHEVLEAAVVAEQSGFHGIFLPEHHFMASGFCSSPLIALSAIAARTRILHLGTSVIVLPCYHPLKLAEDAAQLDLLSGGRVILGLGMGAADHEAATFGVSREDLVSRYEESFEVLRRAWSHDDFSFSGHHFQLSGVRVTPRPLQQPHPPLWMGGMSAPGARCAARFGVPWMTSLMPTLEVLSHLFSIYEKECCIHSHTPRVVLIRDAWIDDDPAHLDSAWWQVAQKEYGSYVKKAPPWMAAIDSRIAAWQSGARFSFEEYARHRLIAGSPQQAFAALQPFLRSLPVEYVILRFRLVAGPSHADTLASLRLFGREVLPLFTAGGSS